MRSHRKILEQDLQKPSVSECPSASHLLEDTELQSLLNPPKEPEEEPEELEEPAEPEERQREPEEPEEELTRAEKLEDMKEL